MKTIVSLCVFASALIVIANCVNVRRLLVGDRDIICNTGDICDKRCKKRGYTKGVCEAASGLINPPDEEICCYCYGTGQTGWCWGDPHCYTWDGYYFHPQQLGRSVMAQSCKGGDNVPSFQVISTTVPYGATATVITHVEVTVYGLHIKINAATGSIEYIKDKNGNDLSAELPFTSQGMTHGKRECRFVRIDRVSSSELVLTTDFGLTVRTKIGGYNVWSSVYVTVPNGERFYDCIDGYLGCHDRDSDRTNDFCKPDGTPTPLNAVLYGWVANYMNTAVERRQTARQKPKNLLAGLSKEAKRTAKKKCRYLKRGGTAKNPFKQCITDAKMTEYADTTLESCVVDIANHPNPENDQATGICETIQTLQHKCAAVLGTQWNDVIWRKRNFCPVSCGSNSHFANCMPQDERTCGKRRIKVVDRTTCVSGCVCDKGYVYDQNNDKCIPKDQC